MLLNNRLNDAFQFNKLRRKYAIGEKEKSFAQSRNVELKSLDKDFADLTKYKTGSPLYTQKFNRVKQALDRIDKLDEQGFATSKGIPIF